MPPFVPKEPTIILPDITLGVARILRSLIWKEIEEGIHTASEEDALWELLATISRKIRVEMTHS